MTDFATPNGTGRTDPGYVPGVTYDRYGRYLLPRPGEDPSELAPWTRVTTLVGTLTSNDGLRIWTEREMLRGLGRRADLRAALAASPEDKETHDVVRMQAKDAAGMSAAATYGRALHTALERAPELLESDEIPPSLDEGQLGDDLRAALGCLRANGLTVAASEQLVVHESLGYAGRLDVIVDVRLDDGRGVRRVLDYKTGKIIDPGHRMTIGAQLAAYVHATHVYDPSARGYSVRAEEIDATTGYVMHVRDGVAQLYEIDLLAGWRDVLLATALHARRRASTHMMPVGNPAPTPASTPAPAPAPASTATRVRRCSICRRPGHTARQCPQREEQGTDTEGAGEGSSPVVQDAEVGEPTLSELIRACSSQDELGRLWHARRDGWGDEHTALASSLARDLPDVTPPLEGGTGGH